jgi:hypothetical protein
MGFYRSLTTSRRDCVDPCRHTRREGAAAAVARVRRRSTEAERQPNRGCADRRWSSLRHDAETAAAARNHMEGARRRRALAHIQGGRGVEDREEGNKGRGISHGKELGADAPTAVKA